MGVGRTRGLQLLGTALLLYVSSIPLVSAQVSATTSQSEATTSPSVVADALATTATSTPIKTNDGIEARVRSEFADAPVMIDIAQCESRFRQFDGSGEALDGGAGGMIGVFQIHAAVHAAYALARGMDIYTLDGNLAYARYLYSRESTNPWVSSLPCWDTREEVAADSGSTLLVSNLSFGMEKPEVRILQQLLNKAGVIIAKDGPGSPGQETAKFGFLTRSAVKNFQCQSGIVCEGDEYATGYGFVGPRTRTALLAAAPQPATAPPAPAPALALAPAQPDAQAEEIARLKKLILELTAELVALQQKQAYIVSP